MFDFVNWRVCSTRRAFTERESFAKNTREVLASLDYFVAISYSLLARVFHLSFILPSSLVFCVNIWRRFEANGDKAKYSELGGTCAPFSITLAITTQHRCISKNFSEVS